LVGTYPNIKHEFWPIQYQILHTLRNLIYNAIFNRR
jgi:hypothetical protein